MPSLTYQEVESYSPFKTNIFVETGTFMGDTISNVLRFFETIYSIELCNKLCIEASLKFKNENHVSILQGDSTNVLETLCPTLDRPVFFWLDGHWSGGITAKGNKDCPLIEEVSSIFKKCRPECIIAIDDVRLFGTNIHENWLDITRESIIDIVKDRLLSVKYYPSNLHPEDRMVLALKGC